MKSLIIILIISYSFVFADTVKKSYPFFAALASSNINVRTGPDLQYPVKWIYKHRNLPVEVIEKSQEWYKIRDFSGSEGWVFTSSLRTTRRFVMNLNSTVLFSDADTKTIKLKLSKGVISEVINCNLKLCYVKVNDTKGYLSKNILWGTYKNEEIAKK